MDHKEVIKQLEKSNEYKEWRKTHIKAYLTHIFLSVEKGLESDLQVGFLEPKTDLISTFTQEDNKWSVREEEVFKHEEHKVEALIIKEVKVDLTRALKAAEQTQGYKKTIPLKAFIILQVLEKPLWNITYTTRLFSALNIKINAVTGEVLQDQTLSIKDLTLDDKPSKDS